MAENCCRGFTIRCGDGLCPRALGYPSFEIRIKVPSLIQHNIIYI